MNDVSVRVKAIRKALGGLSQQALGAIANVSKSAVSQWERGITAPDWAALNNLKNRRRINPEWVMEGSGEMFIQVPYNGVKEKIADYKSDTVTLADRINALPQDKKARVLGYLDALEEILRENQKKSSIKKNHKDLEHS